MQRETAQRRAIRQVFEDTMRPLAPLEVLSAAQEHAPRIGIATVYRTLKGLADEGWLLPVELPGEPVRYETAGKDHHHHFHCRECERVFEVDACGLDLSMIAPRAFQIERHEIVLYGLCAECVRLARAARAKRRGAPRRRRS